MTRVEHHRRLFRTPDEVLSPIAEDHRRRVVEDFVNSGLAKFVQDLRNHFVHRKLPVTRSVTEFGPESWSFSVKIARDDLLLWDKWSPEGRAWLCGQPESVDILDALTQYGDMLIRFDSWLRGELIRRHQAELQRFDRACQIFNEKYHGELPGGSIVSS
jgi:hypothetical protein